LKRYSDREAILLAKKKAALTKKLKANKLKAAQAANKSKSSLSGTKPSIDRKPATKKAGRSVVSKGNKASIKPATQMPTKKTVAQSKYTRKRTVNWKLILIILGSVILLSTIVFTVFKFVMPIINKNSENNLVQVDSTAADQSKILDGSTETQIEQNSSTGATTDFVRNQINTNMIVNSKGNFVTVENSEDYHFMDLVFRETSVDGEMVHKKVIKSEYTTYSYVAKHCNDIIEVEDGYIVVGYQKRGDYAYGSADIDSWIAKIDSSANLVWEKVFDDGFKKGKVLSIEKHDKGFRLYIEYEALENSFLIVDENAQTIKVEKAQNDIVDYDDTSDGGKIFLKKRNSDISIIAKIDNAGSVEYEKYINGSFSHIFSVDEGFVIFGEKEIDLKPMTIVSLFDSDAQLVFEKPISTIGIPKIKNVKFFEDEGYFLTGYIYKTEGQEGSRQVDSLFDNSVQDIQDAWTLKLDNDLETAWEKTYSYGDMGSYFNDIMNVGENKYYLLGVEQCQGINAATINCNEIITGITDNQDVDSDPFVDLQHESMQGTPVIDDVLVSTINTITNGSIDNDYAMKVYWTNIQGASEYEVSIHNGGTKIYSEKTTNINSLVIPDLIVNLGLYYSGNYEVTVSAIDNDGKTNTSNPASFILANNDYSILRNWSWKYSASNRNIDIYFRTCADYRINSFELFRNEIEDNVVVKSELLSVRSEEFIVDDVKQLSHGDYSFRTVIVDNENVKHTMDTEVFTYNSTSDIPYADIYVDELRLSDEVNLNEDEINSLKEIMYVGEFRDDDKLHVRVLQKFINYYLGDLAKLGIYSPETEPESGFDIPIAITGEFNEDTRKATAYMLAYFGRYGVDGKRITYDIDEDLFNDIASFSKRPLSNDIIAAFRYEGDDSKYNAGYSFDTNHNKIENLKLAMPIDHQPLKSAYFGIRYLPILNGEEYDSGVRLHAGIDYRSEDLIEEDLLREQREKNEEYIDTEDKVEEVVVEKKSRKEIRRDRIYSIYDGVVVKVAEDGGNGMHVMVKHVSKDANKEEFYSQYLHLSSMLCTVGQELKRGEILGTMGDTGYSGGKHLHFEIFTPEIKSSSFINPLIYEFAYPPLIDEAKAMEKSLGLIE